MVTATPRGARMVTGMHGGGARAAQAGQGAHAARAGVREGREEAVYEWYAEWAISIAAARTR